MPKDNKKRRVVVTGLGPLSAIGFGKTALWDSILKQKTGLTKEDYLVDGQIWDSFWLHKISSFNIENFGIPKDALDEIRDWKQGRQDRDFYYSLAAVKLALDDSKLKYNRDDNNIGLFFTIEHPGFEPFCEGLIKESLVYLERHFADKDISKKGIYKHLYEKFVENGYDLQTFMYLFLLAKVFGIHGYSLFISNACASGLFAIEAAYKQIKFGNSDAAIVVGGDDTATMFKHMWFKERNLYAEDGKIKPFSKDANGIVFGDGFSAIVLEELGQAKKRKAHIYAEYLGGGFSLEGWKVVFPEIGSGSYIKAINEALKNSQIKPKDIDLINPHGVGIRITDQYEAKAISEIFGKGSKAAPVSAFKPFIGHNLGGSALIETILLLLSMEKNYIPPTLNCLNYDSKYDINLSREPLKRELNTVLKLSCGFAGYNGAAIFKKYA